MSTTFSRFGFVVLTAATLIAFGAEGCGSSHSQKPADSPKVGAPASSGSAQPGAASAGKPAPPPPEAPHCFLGESEANEYAHDLMIAVLSASQFNHKRISRASTPENLKVLESSLRQQMFQVACKKAWTDDADTVEGALVVLALMNLDDKQWSAALNLMPTPQSFRALPAEVADWLKEPGTVESIKTLSRARTKAADDLLAAAAKELKCGKDSVAVRVKSRRLAQVDGCKRTAVMRDDGGWRREAP